jgi:hypothetical protein
MKPSTPYTAAARRKAKRMLSLLKAGAIRIYPVANGFEVMTYESPSMSYGSIAFESRKRAFRHVLCRAANTGHDLSRFSAIADRYFDRFGIPS